MLSYVTFSDLRSGSLAAPAASAGASWGSFTVAVRTSACARAGATIARKATVSGTAKMRRPLGTATVCPNLQSPYTRSRGRPASGLVRRAWARPSVAPNDGSLRDPRLGGHAPADPGRPRDSTLDGLARALADA